MLRPLRLPARARRGPIAMRNETRQGLLTLMGPLCSQCRPDRHSRRANSGAADSRAPQDCASQAGALRGRLFAGSLAAGATWLRRSSRAQPAARATGAPAKQIEFSMSSPRNPSQPASQPGRLDRSGRSDVALAPPLAARNTLAAKRRPTRSRRRARWSKSIPMPSGPARKSTRAFTYHYFFVEQTLSHG